MLNETVLNAGTYLHVYQRTNMEAWRQLSLALKSTFLHIEHFNFVAVSSLKILGAFNLMLFIGPDKITEQSGLAVRIPSARLVERMSHTYSIF